MVENVYLAHHGVKGMKWGVRRYQNPDGSLTSEGRKHAGYPMTKKQAKRAIKTAKRLERKRSGTWMSTGKNMNAVNKQRINEIRNDPNIKDLDRRALESQKQYHKLDSAMGKLHDRSNNTKDHLTRVQRDPNASREIRREVEKQYLNDKRAWENVTNKRNKVYNETIRLENAATEARASITRKYLERYKAAAVRDIGIEDINLGKRMLEDYGLVEKATRMKWR